MPKLPRRLGLRQAVPRPKLVLVRQHRRRFPRKKTLQELRRDYLRAHRRLFSFAL